MELLGLLGISAFWLMSLVVGARLCWLARTTRCYPELAIGVSFLLAGFLGLGMSLVAQHAGLSPDGSRAVSLVGSAFSCLGYGVLAAFVWRVFRAESRIGWIGFIAGVSCLGLGFAVQLATSAPEEGLVSVGVGFWIMLCAQIGIYVWAATESLAYWVPMRRRVRIGLADPLVANRFLLWGIGTGAVALIWFHLGWTRLGEEAVVMSGADYLVVALLGFVTAFCCWVAFLPPGWYVRRFLSPAAA
jgi:hypothetical protein